MRLIVNISTRNDDDDGLLALLAYAAASVCPEGQWEDTKHLYRACTTPRSCGVSWDSMMLCLMFDHFRSQIVCPDVGHIPKGGVQQTNPLSRHNIIQYNTFCLKPSSRRIFDILRDWEFSQSLFRF